MMQSRPGTNPDVSEWKGQDITDFQEDLRLKVNGQLSEKWFYTHMKVSNPSLPRIDALNMLSKYTGYDNWNDFRFKNSGSLSVAVDLNGRSRMYILILSLVLLTIVAIFILRMINIHNYQFTFIDSDTGDPILNSRIKADMFLNNESVVSYTSDKGRISIKTDQEKIRVIIRAPYYITDTVVRVLNKHNRVEKINMRVDTYALLIHYFSRTDVTGWNERRSQLYRIFSEDALIFQLPGKGDLQGMEIYNKNEFIDRLTMPSSVLKRLEIIDCRYKDGKIILLRYRTNPEKDN